jgi:2-polyprenyl-6-methoxyphenol hydroxylase-like FAD-dependent oxidoreductase
VRRYLEPDGGEGSEQVMPQRFTSWEAIFQTLRGAFPDGRYHVGAALGAFDTVDCRIKAEIAGRGQITADLLVCVDGAQSSTRRLLLPDATSDYAGYVAWRGTLDEAVAPAELARFFDDTFTFSEARSGGHILVYYIPGALSESIAPIPLPATARVTADLAPGTLPTRVAGGTAETLVRSARMRNHPLRQARHLQFPTGGRAGRPGL